VITRAGWATLAGAAALAAAGRVLGLVELHVLAGSGALAVAAAAVRTAVVDPGITIRRMVRPPRVHVGTPARVELEVTADGPRATPVLTLDDPIGDRVGARLRLAPLPAGTATRAAYRLPTRRRGEVSVGPLAVEVTDPLGLARRTRLAADRVRLVVLPHIDPVPPLPRPAGSEPLSGHEGRPGAGRSGDEFHALRAYVVGDDLRRVHWPMSARTDDLVVRVDDEPHQGRLTVVLDVHRDRSGAECFERMVSAAASIAAAHWQAGDMVRLLTTDGRDTGWVAGQASFDGLLEALAVTAHGPASDLADVLAHLGDGSDSVAAVVGDVPGASVPALPGRARGRGRGRPGALTVVRFPAGAAAGGAPPAGGRRTAGVSVIDVPPDRSFASAWGEAVAGGRRRWPAGTGTR